MALEHRGRHATAEGRTHGTAVERYPTMRVLLVHNESEFFGGAETVLGYLLESMARHEAQLRVALVTESRFASIVPPQFARVAIADNRNMSISKLVAQAVAIRRWMREFPCDIVHAWAAREWLLGSLVGTFVRRPVLATLHDHPQAPFLTPLRQRLMRFNARSSLRRVVCVSEAVRSACIAAGYARSKLTVVRNGIPLVPSVVTDRRGAVRIGYLGVLTERKGVRRAFAILSKFAGHTSVPWEFYVAGAAQDAAGERMIESIRGQYAACDWWSQVKWLGWVEHTDEFLSALDLVICPSDEFDPLPTVILEAGRAGTPVLAARQGGAPEMITDGETGWLFDPREVEAASLLLARLASDRDQLAAAGRLAAEKVRHAFGVDRMRLEYEQLYRELLAHRP